MKILSNKVTKKVLDSLKAIAEGKDEWNTPVETEEDKEKKEDPDEEKARQIMLRWRRKSPKEKFTAFWEDYGKTIKLGVMEDASNRSRLVKLLRFYSSKSGDKFVSLDEYIENMKEDQEFIYYIAGEDKVALLESALMEKVLDMDYEVLIMDDPLDEFCMSYLQDYKEKKFQNLGRSNVSFGENSVYDEKKR